MDSGKRKKRKQCRRAALQPNERGNQKMTKNHMCEECAKQNIAVPEEVTKKHLEEIDPVSYITAAWLRAKSLADRLWCYAGPEFLEDIWELEKVVADISTVHKWLRVNEGTIDS
jgi:hypothetical protein